MCVKTNNSSSDAVSRRRPQLVDVSFVTQHVRAVSEALVALPTLEWSFACVDHRMELETLFASE